MNKALVFGSVGLLGVGGAVTGISYSSFNFSKKQDLIEELKLLKEEAEESLEKIKGQVTNHKSVHELQELLKDLNWIENYHFSFNFNLQILENRKNDIALLKQNIEQENQDKNEIKNIFKDMEFFSLLIRRMNEKINQLKNQEAAKWEKFDEIKEKLQKYLEDYKKNDSEKLEPLNVFISDVNNAISYPLFLTIDKSIDDLEEEEILMWGEKYKKELKDLTFKNEKLKNIKEDLEVFLNLVLEIKQSIICLFFLDWFLSDEIYQNINAWSNQNNLLEPENE